MNCRRLSSGLKTANLGDSSKVSVGQGVVAVGNAGGTGTPTSAGGSVTNLNQAITAGDDLNGTSENLSGLIETNADIQAGDSGGALVNAQGQVIGMNTAASQGYSLSATGNQGYAIPIDQAVSTADQIEAGRGSSTVHVGSTAFLGILFSSNQGQGQGQGGFGSQGGVGSQSTQGLAVSGAVSGSPAAKAGLGQGDTVTTIDGQAISDYSTIRDVLIQKHPGDTVQIGWTDSSGQSHTSNIVLGSGPAS